jgi:putative ABC transport system ATP-binding protein
MAAILRPASGTITFDGVDVTGLRGPELTAYRRHRVGVVFQAFNLLSSLTATENVQASLRAAGTRARRARARAAELLDRVGLADVSGRRPGELSGGQQQRVAVARALANDPPLLLADEPTAHLDYIQVEGVLSLLRELPGPGRVVVVATHDERMLPLADRVVELTPRAAARSRPPEPVELAEGEVLFAQGDQGDFVYVVKEGRVELFRRRVDGGEELVTIVGPGGYFGELAPTFRLRRSASARAAGPAVVTGYTVSEFRQRAAVDPVSASVVPDRGTRGGAETIGG